MDQGRLGLPKNTQSDTITTWLDQNGGWGAGSFRIDFSIELLSADANIEMRSFEPTVDFFQPDCENVPFVWDSNCVLNPP